jgi:hypothetical protein
MDLLETLIEQTARALAGIKAYALPHACVELGLATGEESEAYDSKYKYVLALRCSLWVTWLGRHSLHSAARRLFKVESDINGILPAGSGPLPFISFLS